MPEPSNIAKVPYLIARGCSTSMSETNRPGTGIESQKEQEQRQEQEKGKKKEQEQEGGQEQEEEMEARGFGLLTGGMEFEL